MNRVRKRVGTATDWWLAFWFRHTNARVYGHFRILFAAVSLLNLIDLWPYRHVLLSPGGMIDRDVLLESIGDKAYYSFLFWVSSEAGITGSCLAAGMAMLLLGLGVLPRVTAIAVFVWHVSFSHAIFPAGTGWDTLLRVYAFLLMISPLGVAWSVPAYLKGATTPKQGSTQITAPVYGILLMRLQLVVIYLDTAWTKLADTHWRSGDLMAYFQMSTYARWPDPIWAKMQLLTCLLTYSALALEALLPLALLTPATRRLAIPIGLALHVGIAASSNLTIFSLAMMACYVVFTPIKAGGRFALTVR